MTTLIYSTFLILVTLLAYRKSHKIRFMLKTVLYFVALSIGSMVGMICAPPLFLLGLGRYSNYIVGQVTKRLVPLLTGIQVQVKGGEHLRGRRPCVLIANHQSRLDMLAMSETMTPGTVVMAKDSLKYYPIIGQYMMLAQNVFINRKNRQSAVETMKKVALQLLKEKTALYMYPEGTRSHQTDNSLLPFKKGAFHLAMQGQIPIVPIVVSTYAPFYSESFMMFEPCRVTIEVLPPVETKGLTTENVDELTDKCRNLMLQKLQEIRTSSLVEEKSKIH